MSPKRKLQAILPAFLAAALCGSAHAATYTAGDLLLGFVASGGTGSDSTLVVNLGSAATFRDAFDSGTNSTSILTIGSQLTSQFGINWYERSDLYVSFFGTTDPSATPGNNTLTNLDPTRTLYASQARSAADPLGSASSAGWSIATNTAMTDSSKAMADTSLTYAASTAAASGVAIIADSNSNTLDEFTRPTSNDSFNSFNGGIEQTFGAGIWGAYGAAGNFEAALDLYRIQARSNVPGQYGSGEDIREGAYAGTFTIDQNGGVSYFATAPVPEPGSALMLSLASAGLLFRRRRA
jgi:hypothetical protein